ncbi:MAG TPA: transglycosylase SLT domain-containing protein [Candidatus Coprenecus stercoravium]|uniref:Transglycosylase SLT domain-containing protein n=1 Tax=Candidatus Coprenecus stercoravium TaxID=2840735 RepID=A0A9D2GPA2_9BACT|nr:transglycosylase SLT domain-containing protein [Candidatus Coprenecus stercoravium]
MTPGVLSPERDPLTAFINIKSGMYSNKGYLTGFQYTLLTGFADSLGREMNFAGIYRHEDSWKMLLDGEVDVVAVLASDTIPEPYASCVSSSMQFRDYSWVTRSEDKALLYQINRWLGLITKGEEYAGMERRFFPAVKERGTISPYDGIVKANSALLGWDWRLLSAVIFKESRFSMGACSRRGAVGLMQVKRSTAAVYGVTDLFNPKENVKAGVLYLRQIQRHYRKMGLDSADLVCFTLAAYNAGESRMRDCINFTDSIGRNGKSWEDVSGSIPLMSQREYYEDADFLRHGKFDGRETLRYVEDVLEIYNEYCQTVRY